MSKRNLDRSFYQVKKLGDVCDIIGGGTPSKSNRSFYVGDIPWATVRDMRSEFIYDTEFKITQDAVKKSSTNIIPRGNVVIATRVGLGKICLLMHDTAINQDLRGMIPKNLKELSIRYLFWWLKSVSEKIIKNGTGATVQGVKLPFIKSLDIPIPPLNEQQRIVAILDKAFSAIALAKKNTVTNIQNTSRIIESFFNETLSIPPNGWKNKKITDIFTIKPPKKEARDKLKNDDFVSFVPMEDLTISTKEFIATKTRKLKEVSGSYTYFADNDVLLAKITPCFENGKVGISRDLKNGVGFGSSEFIVFRSSGELIPDFLYYFLDRDQFRKDGKKMMSGAVGHKRVSMEFINNLQIPYPESIDEQYSIVTKLDELFSESKILRSIYQNKLANLDEFKKTILEKYFNSELTHANIDTNTQVRA